MANLKERFLFICLFIVYLSISPSVCDETTALLEKKIDVDHHRQFGVPALLGGPFGAIGGLALAAMVLPLLPGLFMVPLAISTIGPAFSAVGNFMSNMGGAGLLSPILSPFSSLLSSPDSSSSGSETTSSTESQPGFFSSSVSNTLRGLTQLLFNRRYQPNSFHTQSSSQQTESYNSASNNSATNGRLTTLVGSLRDVYGILKNGLRRYEITNSDCQSRIICEVHQKSFARSYGSIIGKVFDLFGIDEQLEKQNRNDLIKHFVRAARTGLSNKQCENVYYRCVPNHHNSNNDAPLTGHNGQNNGYIDHHSHHYFKQRPAIKSSMMTTPRTVHYYSNINKF